MRLRFLLLLLILSTTQITGQVPELPSFDDHAYFGFEYGAAGISSALIEFDLLDTSSINVISAVNQSLSAIWEGRLVLDGVKKATWSKYADHSIIYPGKKYGAAGIIPVFLKYDSIVGNGMWLHRAEEAFNQLMHEAVNETTLPSWSYSYVEEKEEGIPITDIKFGSAGILETALDLFETTSNSTYLEIAQRILNWMYDVRIEVEVNGDVYHVLPWYDTTSSAVPIITTYGWGNAGVASVLIRLAELTQNNTISSWATELVDYLVSVQNDDGSWDHSSDNAKHGHGLDDGLAGVLLGMHQVNMRNPKNSYDDAIKAGIAHLFNFMVSNSTDFGFIGDDDQEIVDNLFEGTLGILRVLRQLWHYLSNDQKDWVIYGYNWIVNQASVILNSNTKMLIMGHVEGNSQIVDLSYATGIAGMLDEMVRVSKDVNLNIDTTMAMEAAIQSILFFQNNNGLWTRHRLLPADFPQTVLGTPVTPSTYTPTSESWFPIQGLMFCIIILIGVRKKLIK